MELQLSEVYDGSPSCIRAARRTVKAFLARVGTEHLALIPGDTVGCAQLVVSELVTNAVRHAGGECGLELAFAEGVVEIVVWDASPERGTVRPPRPDRVGGHGLEIVHAICGTSEVTPRRHGKQVRVRLPELLAA
ncbi:ATP-binding protein [Streptomyces sp. NPDC090306]|uniref:ATP-binding protein n=1 Tax=unclassified Streptomyces TaxID=2593676 RepID=UPI0036EA0233